MATETAPMLQTMRPTAPTMESMQPGTVGAPLTHHEDTPAYRTLLEARLLTTKYRKATFEDIFEGVDLKANSSKANDMLARCLTGYYVCPLVGCLIYKSSHIELFVPAGHVGLIMNEKQEYLFAQPGMHNIKTCFMKLIGTHRLPINDQLQHGNRTILVVEQGYIGLAFDNGQPVLFPPGIHVWTSETLRYQKAVALDQHVIGLGPYTLLTVDEGYAAVTTNNGRQQILMGGHTHLLDHKNWRFEKFITLKFQTDDLEKIQATSADNITMLVTSTVTWRITDPILAATMSAETMHTGGGKVSTELTKLRQDVLKQAIASLASFIGGVNYSDSFHLAAAAKARRASDGYAASSAVAEPEAEDPKGLDNPIYDTERLGTAVEHANVTTRPYGVEILSINILSALPVDQSLTTALASGAVASAQALQAETAARGNAKATFIAAEAEAEKARIEAEGLAKAEVIKARAQAEAAMLVAEGNKKSGDLLASSQVAVDLAKMEKSAEMLGRQDKFFFGQEPAYLANLVLKGSSAPGKAGIFG